MEKISYRFFIQIGFKLGISPKRVHSELKKIDEDAQTVHNWFHLFKKVKEI